MCRCRVKVGPQCKTPVCETNPFTLSPMFKRHYYTLLLLLLQTVNATQHQQWQQLSEDALEAGNQEESLRCNVTDHKLSGLGLVKCLDVLVWDFQSDDQICALD